MERVWKGSCVVGVERQYIGNRRFCFLAIVAVSTGLIAPVKKKS